jgi:hypothetical protein
MDVTIPLVAPIAAHSTPYHEQMLLAVSQPVLLCQWLPLVFVKISDRTQCSSDEGQGVGAGVGGCGVGGFGVGGFGVGGFGVGGLGVGGFGVGGTGVGGAVHAAPHVALVGYFPLFPATTTHLKAFGGVKTQLNVVGIGVGGGVGGGGVGGAVHTAWHADEFLNFPLDPVA